MANILVFGLTLGSLLLSGEGAPDAVWDGGKLTLRRKDPSRPWLKPENNWGQGFSNSVTKNIRPLGGRRLDPTRPNLKPGNNWGQGKPGSKPLYGTLDMKPGFGTKPFGKPGFGTKPGIGAGPAFGTKPFGKPGFGTKPGIGAGPAFGTKPFGKPGFGTKPYGKPGFGTSSGWKPGNGGFQTKPWARPSGLTKDKKLGGPGNPWAGAGNPYNKPGFKYGGSAKNLKFSGAGNPYTKDIKFGGSRNPWAGAANPYTKPGRSPFKVGSIPCRPNRANNFCGSPGWKPAVVKPGEINLGRVGGHGLSGFQKQPSLITKGNFGTKDFGKNKILYG